MNKRTKDTLVNAINYFANRHDINTATVLMKKYVNREQMRFGIPDLDEEEPLSEEEFSNWIKKHLN